ncbi:MAG: tyrosine-type recombinase/integrase [Firmicutes bacterium]|nr:tyrosine-type recombinase/integrase [Bacillota bacterium]
MRGRWDESGYVFINKDTGKRISPDTILTWVNRVTEAAGLGYWTVHSLRHTNITALLTNNVPLFVVSKQAGHSRTQTTTDVYGHYLKTHRSVAPQIMDRIVGIKPEEPSTE